MLGACTVLAADGGSAAVAVEGPGNRLTLTMAGEIAQFDVYSERGIGRARIQWLAATYPREIILRLHLRGLEGFSLSYGDTTVQLGLPTSGDGVPLQSRVAAQAGVITEQSLSPDSPDWLETAVVGRSTAAGRALPLADGYIEVALPAHFFAQRATHFSIQWVDFYR
jgi:hypothetical protein